MHSTLANASNASPLPTTSPPSPYLDTPSASAILLPLLALITVMLDTPCFLWHLTTRNAAASMLVGWVMLENVIVFINGLLWPTDDLLHWWRGQIYCDVAVKLDFAAGYAIGACALCIMRALASALDTKRQSISPSLSSRRRAAFLLYGLTVGLPIYSIVAAYIVQPQRYYIVAISGCAMAERNTALTVGLCYGPLILLMAATAWFAALVLLRLYRYRRDLAAVLASTESGLSRTRFLRLLGLALVVLLVYTPLFLYIVYGAAVANGLGPFEWDVVHDPATWDVIVLVQSFGAARTERWVRPSLGVVVFACFGFGRDIRKTYCKCFRSVGLGRVVERLRLDEEDGDGAGAGGRQGRGAQGRNRRAKQYRGSSSDSSGFSALKGRARRVISKLSLSSSLGSTSSSSYSRNTDSIGSNGAGRSSGARHSPNKTVFAVDVEQASPVMGSVTASVQQQQQQQRHQDGPYELAGYTGRATGLLERALYDNDGSSGIGTNTGTVNNQKSPTVDTTETPSTHVTSSSLHATDKQEALLKKYHGSMRPVRIHAAPPSPPVMVSTPPPTYQQAASSFPSSATATAFAPGTATANLQPAHPSFTSRFWARLGSYVQCMPARPAPLMLGAYGGGSGAGFGGSHATGGGASLGLGLVGYGYGYGGAGDYQERRFDGSSAATGGPGLGLGERREREFERFAAGELV